MKYGPTLPLISGGFPSASMWNDAARALNALTQVSLGGGLRGGLTSSGLRIVGVQGAGSGFPYGDSYCFGLGVSINEDSDNVVTIYNPIFMRQGVIVSEWFGVGGDVTPFPDKNDELEVILATSDWKTSGTAARTLIYCQYDQRDNTTTLHATATPSDGVTLPTNDGAGQYDAAAYIKIPLYILSGTYDSETGKVLGPALFVDLIHGQVQLPLM